MIEPVDADVGREVTYYDGREHEHGVITSFNDKYVFVRYGSDKQSKATRRESLHWSATR